MSVLDSFSLKGKVALVTGGAGLYSRQIVQALAEAGAKTFTADCQIDQATEQEKTSRKAGLDVTALQYDQAEEESILALLDKAVELGGHVDILVNSAVVRPMKDWSDPAENFARSMQINGVGLFIITRAFGDHMASRGSGSIINIGSIQGLIGPDLSLYEGLPWTSPPDYYFHKGGMIQLTRFAASTLGRNGVRVNVICPGGMFSSQEEVFVKRYNARTFLGRMGNETDLKGIIVFLASDASAYVTGTVIPVDAGYTTV